MLLLWYPGFWMICSICNLTLSFNAAVLFIFYSNVFFVFSRFIWWFTHFTKFATLFKVSKRGRGREDICILVHSPNGYKGQGWARPKPEARSFFWVSPWVQAQALGKCFPAFSGALEGSQIRSGAVSAEPATLWEVEVADLEYRARSLIFLYKSGQEMC